MEWNVEWNDELYADEAVLSCTSFHAVQAMKAGSVRVWKQATPTSGEMYTVAESHC